MATTHCQVEEDRDATSSSGGLPQFKLSALKEERDTGQAIWVRGFLLEVYGYVIEVSRSYKNTVTVSVGII